MLEQIKHDQSMNNIFLPIRIGLLLITASCFSSVPAVFGEQALPFEEQPEGEKKPWYQISYDRNLAEKMNTVIEFGKKDRPLEAAIAMQAVIEHQADYFLHSSKYRSTRHFLRRWVEQQPEEVLNAYEVQYGPAASNLLKQFQKTGNRQALLQIVQKYLHTKAGTSAAYRLACLEFDEGRFLAAAVNFERLSDLSHTPSDIEPWIAIKSAYCWMKLGQPKKAERIIQQYEQRNPDKPIPIAGQPKTILQIVESFSRQISNRSDRLSPANTDTSSNRFDWPMFRRSARRDKLNSQFSPLPAVKWKTDLTNHLLPEDLPQKNLIGEMLVKIFTELESDKYTTLPAWNPIIIDRHIIASGFGTVAAFSLDDGRLLWKSSTHDHVLEYLQSEELLTKLTIRGAGGLGNYEQYLIQQIAADLTTGTVSSDGKRVFAIRECGIVNGSSRGILQAVDSLSIVPNQANRLCAFDLNSGRILWEVGGLFGGQSQEYSGHFFLGPPVIVNSNAYLLSESGGQVLLSQIDTNTGQALWMQPLALPEAEILLDGPRRLAGSSPVFLDPFLICATNAGTVIAIDLEAKELRWIYSYKQNGNQQSEFSPFNARQARSAHSLRPVSLSNMVYGSRWQDFVPVVAGNRLLLTPVDSDDLFCLDLLTGKLLWSEIRRDGLYIDVVNQEDVLIIGKRTLRSLNIKTGISNWPRSVSIAPASGRGVLRGSIYQLPTLNDGLHSYDTQTGTLLATTETSTFLPGNLIVTDDQLITIRNGQLIALQPLHRVREDIKQKLQSNPQNAATLSQLGQLELHLGNIQNGLSLLQKSYRIERLPETARQITKTILNADQIVLSDKEITELSELMVSAEHSTEIVLRYVQALQQHHKSLEALFVLRTLLETPARSKLMIPVSGEQRVRVDSVIKGTVKDIFASADEEQIQNLNREILQWFSSSTDTSQFLTLQPFCANRTLTREFRLRLVRQEDPQLSPLNREKHLLWLKRNGTRTDRAEATARLARLLLSQNKQEEASLYLQELMTKFQHVDCLNQQTGEQLVTNWKQNDKQIQALLTRKLGGLVLDKQYEISIEPEEIGRSISPQQVEITGSHPAGSAWEFWNFRVSPRGPKLIARSADAKAQLSVSLEGIIKSVRFCTLQTEGHLIVLCNEGSLVGIDGFGQVLWNEKFNHIPDDQTVLRKKFVGQIRLTKSYGAEIGEITTLKDHQFACRLGSKISLREAFSGDILWEYETNSQTPLSLWMDDESVYVINPQNRKILPLRLEDGKPGKITQLPPHQQILAMQGNVAVLFNRLSPDKGILTGYDFTNRKIIWNQTSSSSVSIASAGNGLLALHDLANRKLMILDPGRIAPLLFQFDTPATTDSRLIVRSDPAHWYFHFTMKPQPISQPLDNQSPVTINGPMIAVSKQTHQTVWTQNIENLRWLSNQPAALPFLIYAALVPGSYRDDNGNQQSSYLPKLKIIHKKTGKEITGIPENFTGLLIAMKHDFKKEKFKLLFRTGTILIEAVSK